MQETEQMMIIIVPQIANSNNRITFSVKRQRVPKFHNEGLELALKRDRGYLFVRGARSPLLY